MGICGFWKEGGGGRFEKGETMTSVCSMMSSPYPKLIAYVFVVGSIGSVI